MRRIQPWGLSLLLAAGAGAPLAAADPPTAPARPGTLFGKLFGPSESKSRKEAAGRGSTSMRPPTVTAPLPPEVLAGSLRAEQDAWERRMSVCLKLREIAIAANDEVLLRQVDELERQATALYNVRVAALGVPKVKSPLPEESSAAAVLDRRLGTGIAVDPLTAPPPPTPVSGTASARPTGDVREVRP